MLRCATALVAGLAGCAAPTDVTLRLVDLNGDCDAAAFEAVHHFSLEVLATNGRCRLNHTCMDDRDDIVSVETLSNAIATRFSDILFEVSSADAQMVVINGRPDDNCFPGQNGANAPVICGGTDLALARDGILEIDLDAVACLDTTDLCDP